MRPHVPALDTLGRYLRYLRPLRLLGSPHTVRLPLGAAGALTCRTRPPNFRGPVAHSRGAVPRFWRQQFSASLQLPFLFVAACRPCTCHRHLGPTARIPPAAAALVTVPCTPGRALTLACHVAVGKRGCILPSARAGRPKACDCWRGAGKGNGRVSPQLDSLSPDGMHPPSVCC